MKGKGYLLFVSIVTSVAFSVFGQSDDSTQSISLDRLYTNIFTTPLSSWSFIDWKYQFIEAVEYDSIIIRSENRGGNNLTQKFFFNASGKLSSHTNYSFSSDTLNWFGTNSFINLNQDTVVVSRSFTVDSTIVNKDIYMTTVLDSAQNKYKWILLNSNKQSVAGWEAGLTSLDGNYWVTFKNYGKSIHLIYSKNNELLEFRVTPSCRRGYCPKRYKTVNLRKGRKVLALELGFPGGGYDYPEKRKTNFHRREEQILKRFGRTTGEIEKFKIYRFNSNKTIKTITVKTIVKGRFKRAGKIRYQYY